jgi:integral membrane protein (TIGR01906 family)
MKKNRIWHILFIILFIISLYLTSAKNVLYNEEFHNQEFEKLGVYDKISNANEISGSIIDFYQNKGELHNEFNEDESSHLSDVKILINKSDNLLLIFSISLIILLSLILFNNPDISKMIISTGIGGLILPIPALLFNFTNVFTKFHLIFFPQGNWQFPLDSLLIQLFPKQFFYDSFVLIILKSYILSVLIIIIGFISSINGSNKNIFFTT